MGVVKYRPQLSFGHGMILLLGVALLGVGIPVLLAPVAMHMLYRYVSFLY